MLMVARAPFPVLVPELELTMGWDLAKALELVPVLAPWLVLALRRNSPLAGLPVAPQSNPLLT
jgi:hypothetical protein